MVHQPAVQPSPGLARIRATQVYPLSSPPFRQIATARITFVLPCTPQAHALIEVKQGEIMPKVVRFHQLGGPEVLKFEDQASRDPKTGEVRIRVQAVGLNRAEALYARGQYLEQPRLPSGLGYEAAGIIEAVGPDVDRTWVGHKIATVPGFSQNDYPVLGEEAVVPVANVAPYPEKLTPTDAAAMWMQYLTAWGGLVSVGHIAKDDFVVISAASSSVGVAAIQIAKEEGAIAIATTRTSKKREELHELGADHVIATAEEDLVTRVDKITGGKGARVLFDSIAGPFVEQLAAAAADHAILIEYGSLSLKPTPFPLVIAMHKQLTMRAYTMREINANHDLSRTAREYVFDRVADGRFQIKIARTFPFADTVKAYQYLESNEQIGKVVITL
jgi:NADPH:quinone reductase-like Zn-dependent oxidoreductase